MRVHVLHLNIDLLQTYQFNSTTANKLNDVAFLILSVYG